MILLQGVTPDFYGEIDLNGRFNGNITCNGPIVGNMPGRTQVFFQPKAWYADTTVRSQKDGCAGQKHQQNSTGQTVCDEISHGVITSLVFQERIRASNGIN